MTFIETSNLKKEYKNKNRRVAALKDATLSFGSKGLVFILGESGAGKSTLLNLLSLQEKPTSGKLILDGKDVNVISSGERSSLKNDEFAILFQDLNLLEEFSVYDNLRLARQIQGKDLGKDEAIEMLSRFSLPSNIIDEMPFSLSGGQRQRVALARALVKDFKVLFCDEPTASLDEENATIVAECLKEIAKDHLVIAATHDTALAKRFGDRVITIKDGNVSSDVANGEGFVNESKGSQSEKKQGHLPFETLLKLAMHGVKTSIPRFVFALISTFLTLSVFMVSMSFYCYDEMQTTYACLRKEGVSYLELVGNEKIDDNHSNCVYFPYDKKLELEGAFNASLGVSMSYSAGIFDEAKKNFPEETRTHEKAYCFNSSNIKEFGFEVIGEMPKYDSSILEIALTKLDCYYLGYTEEVSSNDSSVYENIIKTASFQVKIPVKNSDPEKKNARVTAIIDTRFKDYGNGEMKEMAKIMKTLELDNEAHFGVFFDENTYKSIVSIGNGVEHVYVPTSAKPLEKIAEFNSSPKTTEKGYAYTWDYLTRFGKSFEAVRGTQKTYSGLALVISMFLLTVAGLAFVSFVISSVSSLRPSVMVLESLGVSKSSAMRIYAFEALFLGLICGLASVLPYYFAVEWFGSFLATEVLIPVSPFSFNFVIAALSIVGVCALAIGVALLVSVLSKPKRV